VTLAAAANVPVLEALIHKFATRYDPWAEEEFPGHLAEEPMVAVFGEIRVLMAGSPFESAACGSRALVE